MLLTETALTLRSIRFTRPESTLPGPDLDEGADASAHELRRRLREAHRRGELVDEERPHPLRRLDAGGHRRHEGRHRLLELHLLDRGAQPVGGARDERRVERARDLELDGAAGSLALRLLDALVDGEVLARDDDLPGAVVVRGPDAEDLAAETLDDLVGEAEDGGHRAGVARCGVGHGQAALAHERHRLFQRHRLGRGQRRELPDRVADHEVGLDAPIMQGREHREGGRDERRLLHRRVESSSASAWKQSRSRSRPLASLPRLKTSIAAGTASAKSRPMPASNEPWPGKQNAILFNSVASPSSTASARFPR